MRQRDKKHFLTQEDLGQRAPSDPQALAAWHRWRAIKQKGGMPIAWWTARCGYSVHDELEIHLRSDD